MNAHKIQSMDVYEDLQDPYKQLVLTNLRQFQDDEDYGRIKTAKERQTKK